MTSSQRAKRRRWFRRLWMELSQEVRLSNKRERLAVLREAGAKDAADAGKPWCRGKAVVHVGGVEVGEATSVAVS